MRVVISATEFDSVTEFLALHLASQISQVRSVKSPADSLDSKSVTMIVRKISEKGLQIGKLSRTEKLEKRGAFLEQLLEKF